VECDQLWVTKDILVVQCTCTCLVQVDCLDGIDTCFDTCRITLPNWH
jgi:hypothetical protein